MEKCISTAHILALVSALLVFTVGLGIASAEDGGEIAVIISDADWVEEWVEIINVGEPAQELTNWTLQDETNHTYTFPVFVLARGGVVTVHTETGNNTDTDLYWNRATVWNNDGDVATLADDMGNVIAIYPPDTM
ncbi:MAG: lamin tail domain-containing protein [Euryarchaeota archaeon]|nr:lamin tail domain-containing protein [Euryarchaeota archaeon]